MSHIELYTRPGCGYCTHAKRLLKARGLAFDEYDVYRQPQRLSELHSRTRGRSYPQVFIDSVSIGGFEELLQLQQNNKLLPNH